MTTSRRSGGACTRRKHQDWQPRRNIRLPREAYLNSEPFLLTICTSKNKELLTTRFFGQYAYEAIFIAAEKTNVSLWCAVVMPDHIHVLVSAHRDKTPLDMAYCYKRLVTLFARKEGYRGRIWQRRIYDRGIRSEFSNNIELAARYILENPVRAQLANDWHEWPYSYLHSDIE